MNAPGARPPAGAKLRRLVVLGKAPRHGLVKTRLAAVVGPDVALAVHESLTARVLAEVEAALRLGNVPDGMEAEFRVTPDEEAEGARTWVPSPIRIRTQGPGGLGDRMHRAFDEAFAEGATEAILIGTDCPGFSRRHPVAAFEALARADVVLGPAADGGYWLIGARAPTPAVFDGVAWSTASVLATTWRLAHATGRTVALLEMLSDVDTAGDLERLRASPLDRKFLP